MKSLAPYQLMPLNIFQVLGTTSCANLQQEFSKKQFSQSILCYDAISIHNTNVLIIWGSIAQRLVASLQRNTSFMASNRYIIHIRGCECRIDNHESSSSLANVLPVNAVFSRCVLTKKDYSNLVLEARKCLSA